VSDASFQLPALFDLGATFAFALTGALAGVKRGYDIVGIFFLALVSSIGGGLIRDAVFIPGSTATPLLTDPRYIQVVLTATLVCVVFGSRITHFRRVIAVVDALGLGAYAAFGTQKALLAGLALLLLPLLVPELSRPRDAFWGAVVLLLGLVLVTSAERLTGAPMLAVLCGGLLIGRLGVEVGQGRWRLLTEEERQRLWSKERWQTSLSQIGASLGRLLQLASGVVGGLGSWLAERRAARQLDAARGAQARGAVARCRARTSSTMPYSSNTDQTSSSVAS
jgi:hypothetical protein